MGLTKRPVIDDVLERYEAYLASLSAAPDTGASTPPPSLPTP